MKRFWDKVDKSGGDEACWLWTGYLDRAGYGRIILDGNYTAGAHRVSAFLAGLIPTVRPKDGNRGNDLVLHRCDNPACVNPKHFFIGSHRANMDDMLSKARQAWGERGGSARLTNDDAETIHEARRLGVQAKTIADYFGTAVGHIHAIKNGRTRKLRSGEADQVVVVAKLVELETRILPADRLEARNLFAAGNVTRTELAKKYGVSLPTMSVWLRGVKGLRQKYPPRKYVSTPAINTANRDTIEDVRMYWDMGMFDTRLDLYQVFRGRITWADVCEITGGKA